ncbi:MAG TPA: thiamine phosphate synthase [Syntrophomonas sp.]|jgi:thiamine-phosphate pyrophosphorylase|nr:thiamine phosphate synthase [Syntrophomonas sp.]HCF70110.1 thiamine phosphate synthase [Syntrophomonas sp.]
MSTFDILAISSRRLCPGKFLRQIEKIAQAQPAGIILREKELSEEEYTALARAVLKICEGYRVKCILHTFVNVAIRLNCKAIHLPLVVLRQEAGQLGFFKTVGVSIHSPEEAAEAEKLGASYLTAGHIFATDCKRGVTPRGLPFLQSVTEAVHIPVYAIGGITPQNAKMALASGAGGVCVMSGFMSCADPKQYLSEFEKALRKPFSAGI